MTVVCALAVALAAPAAFAQEPTRQGYGPTGQDPRSLGAIEGLPPSDGSGGSAPASEGSGPATEEAATEEDATEAAATESLPFTGLDVGIVALLGAALLGTGIMVRRGARSSQA